MGPNGRWKLSIINQTIHSELDDMIWKKKKRRKKKEEEKE
jgi:hypothetical protein